MTDEEILKKMHINLHAVRLIKGYKPSEFEVRISKLLLERFKNTCDECHEVAEKPIPEHKNFLHKLGDLFK
jgi:hypothetical protein